MKTATEEKSKTATDPHPRPIMSKAVEKSSVEGEKSARGSLAVDLSAKDPKIQLGF